MDVRVEAVRAAAPAAGYGCAMPITISSARLQWLVAWLFMVGGSCFAIASVPFAIELFDARVLGMTYVIGAVFFTSAAFCQFQLVGNEQCFASAPTPRSRVGIRLRSFRWRSILWWSCAVQLVGTVYFNVNTINALDTTLSVQEELRVVWRPEAIGSICFLVASLLALLVLDSNKRRTGAHLGTTDFWISWWNMLGSVLFGVSTVAGKLLEPTSEPRNVALMNATTMTGAICFIVGAWLFRPGRH
jgi:hypothetical protein